MKTIKHMLFTFLCMVFMIAIFSQPVAAQATLSYAELNGTIQDPSEQVIVGATVAIRNMGTNREYNAISSNSGTYILPNLPPGQYELIVSYTGFNEYKGSVELSVGQTATVKR